MTGGAALGARAVGDTGGREVAREWAGPDPALPRARVVVAPDPGRRIRVRRP